MKNFFVLAGIVVLQVVGNLFLSSGLRNTGGPQKLTASAVLQFCIRAAATPDVLLGVGLLIAFFLFYLAALSRLDLSYVLPMTAFTYVLTALLAWRFLGETVSASRWLGTVAVSVGILFVGESERRKKPASVAADTEIRSGVGETGAGLDGLVKDPACEAEGAVL